MIDFFLDIETIPCQRQIDLVVKPPKSIKKLETLDKWTKETKPGLIEEALRKTSLSGTFGEIVSIGYAFDDEPVKAVTRNNFTERELLKRFFTDLFIKWNEQKRSFQWIGHNITGFDLRFIWQRSVVNKIRPPINIPYDAKPWSDYIYDTMIEWDGKSISLDNLCKALEIEGKGDVDGSKVYDLFLEGEFEKIHQYCMSDVEKVRSIYKRMTFKEA